MAASTPIALLAVIIAGLIRYALVPIWGTDNPFLTFFPAVTLTAWYGGLGAGLLAVGLSTLVSWYFVPPLGFLPLRGGPEALSLALFVVTSVLIVWMTERTHRERLAAEHARDAARTADDRLRAALDIGAVNVIDLDLRVETARAPSFFGMPGANATPIAGGLQSWLRVVYPDDVDTVSRELASARDEDREYRVMHRLVRSDGALQWVEARGRFVYDPEGEAIRLLGAFVDVTDTKRANDERKQTAVERDILLAIAERARAEAERASRAKDDFLATISHELRTPLSPILAWARMLRLGALDADKSRLAIETIERCARAQAQLIEDLLDVSRIVAGQFRLDVRPVELAPIIETTVDVIRAAADAKSIRVQLVLDRQVGRVSGDPARLQQVFWNLLSNAVKFTPKGGRVHVVLQRVDSHVEIAITDTGRGISPLFLPHVFERFQQADSSSSRSYAGLGLGLAIVRHIVEAHGGTVHAESEGEGLGSVFTLQMPLNPVRTAEEAERRHPDDAPPDVTGPSRLDNLRIMVVDDEPDSNEVVRTILSTYGAEVHVATSAAQGREELARWAPEVVISDVGMPGEDGYEFISSIRGRDDELAGVPAVALTAYASVEDRIRLISAGFQAHVAKPVDPLELVTIVASIATRNRPFGRRQA